MSPGLVILGLWIAWAASWLLASGWSNATEKRVGLGRELGYRVVLVVGAVLFFIPAHGYEGALRVWHVGFTGVWACIAAMAAGFAFCWWARVHLGRLWSGTITKKEGHRIVDTGPYAVVRHPIYTGLLVAVLATMIAKGTILGFAGAAMLALGIYLKARMEEQWLRGELGADAYDGYRRRVPMLLPFGPKAR